MQCCNAARTCRPYRPTPKETVMALTAKTQAEKTTDTVAELGKLTTAKAVDVTREATDKAEDAARRGHQAVQRTADAALEVERAVARQSAEGTARSEERRVGKEGRCRGGAWHW